MQSALGCGAYTALAPASIPARLHNLGRATCCSNAPGMRLNQAATRSAGARLFARGRVAYFVRGTPACMQCLPHLVKNMAVDGSR